MKIAELLNHIIFDGPKPPQKYNKKFESDENNPLTILSTDTNHPFAKCKDDNCVECNYTTGKIWSILKTRINQEERIRMPKMYMIKMNNFFGEKITKKAQNNFNQTDVYKRRHYNIIPCSCRTKSHHDCEGYYGEKLNNPLKSTIHRSCKCKRHSRPELKRFKKHEGSTYL